MRCTRCDLPVFEDDQGLYNQVPVTHPEMPGFTFMDRAHQCGDPPAPHAAPHVAEGCPLCDVPMTVEDGLWYCAGCDAYHGEAEEDAES